MAGMPSAGPPGMAVPTLVTEPGVQRSTSALPEGTSVKVRSGVPPLTPTSSEKGATGTFSGTLMSAMSEELSVPTNEAGSRWPPGPTRSSRRRPLRRSAVVATMPPSATATPMSVVVPCAVTALSSTMEWPVASAAAGTAFWGPGSVETGAAAVSRVAPVSGWSEAGDSKMTSHATAAITANAPTRTMTALRHGWRFGGLMRRGAGAVPALGVATSLGCRHRRSSGSIQPRSAASASSFPVLSSSGPGSPSRGSSGSSGGSLTWARLPRSARKVPSRRGSAVP